MEEVDLDTVQSQFRCTSEGRRRVIVQFSLSVPIHYRALI